jgi:hypothetical protein
MALLLALVLVLALALLLLALRLLLLALALLWALPVALLQGRQALLQVVQAGQQQQSQQLPLQALAWALQRAGGRWQTASWGAWAPCLAVRWARPAWAQ